MALDKWRTSKWGVLAVSSLAVFTDMVVYGAVMPILEKILKVYGKDTDDARSLISITYALGLFIFTPIFGIMSDRYRNRRVPMILGQAGLAASTLMFVFSPNYTWVLLARFLQGAAGAATWVVGLAMLTDVFAGPNLSFYMSFVFSCHTVGFFSGPLLSGFLYDSFGMRAPFYTCAALAIIDLLGRLWIKEPPRPQSQNKTPHIRKSKGLSIPRLLQCPEIVLVNVVIMLKAASYSSIEVFMSKHLERFFAFTPSDISLTFLAFILPNIIMANVVSYVSKRVLRHKIMTLGMLLHLLVMPLVTSETSIPVIIVGGVLFGATISLIGTPVMPELAGIVESFGGASYARVYAILNMCYSLGMMFGPHLVEHLNVRFDFMTSMLALNSIMFVFAPVFFLAMNRLHKQRLVRLAALSETTPDGVQQTA